MHFTTRFAVWRKRALYLQVLSVGGLNLVSPETTDNDTGDANVERDLSPEVSGLYKLYVSTCFYPSSIFSISIPTYSPRTMISFSHPGRLDSSK